jgi:hypothetical protein
VIDEKSSWQPKSNPNTSEEWGPAAGQPTSHAVPEPGNRPRSGHVAVISGRTIARGQIDDPRPDSAMTLIRKLCHGRATGVDVRWAGGEKVRVTFDCRTAAAAQRLVSEISSRPELAPLQIEFSVLVK